MLNMQGARLQTASVGKIESADAFVSCMFMSYIRHPAWNKCTHARWCVPLAMKEAALLSASGKCSLPMWLKTRSCLQMELLRC